MQITGGYYADPGFKDVPRVADCGYPIAEVAADGNATITKLASAGGMVSTRTVKEQLLYEVHDPTAYLTPDVTADFSRVGIDDRGQNRVDVSGASGTVRPRTLKVTVGFDGGHLGEGGISYAGPNAVARATLARDILADRLGRHAGFAENLRLDLIGVDSLHQTARGDPDPSAPGGRLPERESPSATSQDIRVRVAMRSMDRSAIETMLWEVESLLCCGPAGGGGYRGQISPSVITHSALIDRGSVSPTVKVLVA